MKHYSHEAGGRKQNLDRTVFVSPIMGDVAVDSPQRWRSAPVLGRSNIRSSGAASNSCHCRLRGCCCARGHSHS